MVRGGALLEAEGDIKGALHLVRRALAHDAWREDLYQAAMRYQIEVGQRSAAVDTFMACKGKLAEDLGLDPSAATRRLYDQILAMEDDGDWDR
jgi:DNA-binding SARP family transcriptional activator